MSEDITFCGYDCPNKKCERNRKNIKQHWLDHSFAYFEDCVYRRNNNVRIRDLVDEEV